jgi:MscS family membrane protein
METIEQIFSGTFLGIGLGRYAIAFGILIFVLILKKVLAHLFTHILFPFAEKTESRYDDLFLMGLKKPAELLILIGGLFIIVQVLQLPVEPVNVKRFAYALLKMLATFDVAWFAFNMVSLLEAYLGQWVSRTESTLDDHLLPFIRKSLRIFIIFLAVLMAIQNLGYSISGLLASLGIGGLAVALAAKDTLANVFGSVMIIVDRPFHIGDAIRAGDIEGTVEEVGFRSTKIRTFDRSLISVPNSVITNLAVNNFSRWTNRRIRFTVGLTYDTPPEQLRVAVARIRTLLLEHEAIHNDGVLVHFTDFGASSLDILVQCFALTADYSEHLAIREEICLKIMDILAALDLEIAFPSRTVYLQGKETDMLPAPAEKKHGHGSKVPGPGSKVESPGFGRGL